MAANRNSHKRGSEEERQIERERERARAKHSLNEYKQLHWPTDFAGWLANTRKWYAACWLLPLLPLLLPLLLLLPEPVKYFSFFMLFPNVLGINWSFLFGDFLALLLCNFTSVFRKQQRIKGKISTALATLSAFVVVRQTQANGLTHFWLKWHSQYLFKPCSAGRAGGRRRRSSSKRGSSC